LDAGRTLLIEPDGILAALPFQALIEPNGSYVGWEIPIAYSPGLEYTIRLRSDAGLSSSSRALVVGEPLSGLSTSNITLPDANREAHWVSTLFNNSVLITGREATAAAIVHNLSHTNAFHFAGHAFSGPDGIGLEVSSGSSGSDSVISLLGPDRIASADLRALRLAVLSACSTGRAGDDGLAGPGSLAAAFLRAGVPNVVASRWNVDSSATARFMALLYPALIQGRTVADSLLLASREAGSSASASHPYFWAAFSVYGRT
jgi:CHAT domain-containing protein